VRWQHNSHNGWEVGDIVVAHSGQDWGRSGRGNVNNCRGLVGVERSRDSHHAKIRVTRNGKEKKSGKHTPGKDQRGGEKFHERPEGCLFNQTLLLRKKAGGQPQPIRNEERRKKSDNHYEEKLWCKKKKPQGGGGG